MKKLILGIIIGVFLPAMGGYIFLITGGMPVATKGPPLPLERFVARTAIHAAMRSEGGKISPLPTDEESLLKGARVYTVHCAVCHGLSNVRATSIAKGLFPKPPQLFEPDHGVTDDPIGETFWKVKNGIRLTGMPGFVDSLSETEMWQVSQLLLNSDKLPAGVREVLKPKNQ